MEPESGPLHAENIVVQRGPHRILEGVALQLNPGTVTVLTGPNGAGKSTLLKVLTGELTPEEGRVSWRGRELSRWELKDLARRRAVMAQESSLSFPFTVEEVVMLGRLPHDLGGDSAQDREAVRESLARVDLSGFAKRLYPSLSGGEKQRVHLARALAQIAGWTPRDPPLLFLDEPIANLDLEHRFTALELARQTARDGGTVLCVLHDLSLTASYADNVLVLHHGRLVAQGPPNAVLHPALLREVFSINAEIRWEKVPWLRLSPLPDEK